MGASVNISPLSRDGEFAEAYAVFQGIKLAIDLGLTPLIIELDSVNIVTPINGSLSSTRSKALWLIEPPL